MKNKYIFEWVQCLLDNNLKVYLVGGCVIDMVLNIEPKDLDYLIVGAKSLDQLETLLKLQCDGFEFDIAVPRKETKTGEGHTGFEVLTENVTLEEDLYHEHISK